MKFFLILLMFFVLSALVIISNNELAMSHEESAGNFSSFYFAWLNQVYLNIQTITGEIVKMSWFPINK